MLHARGFTFNHTTDNEIKVEVETILKLFKFIKFVNLPKIINFQTFYICKLS